MTASQPSYVITLGEVIAEFFATERGQSFTSAGTFAGPFAAGAPAIFIGQVGRLGEPCTIISAVGQDDFGTLNLNQLRRDGVDTAGIAIDPEWPTGTSFVRYHDNGDRDFIFNIKHSACGNIAITPAVRALLKQCRHLHVVGSSLFAQHMIAAANEAMDLVKAQGGTISFDPNIRKEILNKPAMLDALAAVLKRCDVFLPSGEELTLLTQAKAEEDAIAEIFNYGVRVIVHKRGAEGARYIDRAQSVDAPVFDVAEVDPTGAGDCFGAAFVTFWLRGLAVTQALTYASAAGARAVSVKGAMEGIASQETLDKFIATTAKKRS